MTEPPSARPSGRWRRPGLWILAAVLLLAVGLPGGLSAAHAVRFAPAVGVAHPLASTPSFSVSLTDSPAYSPRYLNATVSGPVTVSIALLNTGSLAHTFTVVNSNQSGVVLNRSWTPAQLNTYFAKNGSLANVNVSAGLGAWANFSLPASTSFRSFEFVSTIPYQFQAGMWGFLNLTPAGTTLTLSENTTNAFQFVPNELSAGPSVHGAVTLDILVTNLGDIGHTFTVSAQPNVTLSSIGYFSKNAPLKNVSVPANTGGTVWANFTVPGVGVYEYACAVPGHFASGMFGFLYVGVAVPAPSAPPSTAIVEIPVLIGSALILGVGLVLTLGSAFFGRFPKKPSSRGPHH